MNLEKTLPWVGGTIEIRAVTGLIQIHENIQRLSVIERRNVTVLVSNQETVNILKTDKLPQEVQRSGQ